MATPGLDGRVAAVRQVDLVVDRGEILALIGANGAGKTTLISIVAGLAHPDAGMVRVLGIDALARPGAVRSMVGLAPQDLGVYPTASTQENLQVFGELAGLRGRALADRVEGTAAALGLASVLRRPVRELSGGQKRRVHVAIAVIHRPRLLLLDEPSISLDAEGRTAVVDLVKRLAADGSAVLYSTNQLAEAESLGGPVAILHAGRIAVRGSLAELVALHGGAVTEEVLQTPTPSRLERVFLALTGHRYQPAGVGVGEQDRDAALP